MSVEDRVTAALHALAEFLNNFFTVFRHIAIVYETPKKCKLSEVFSRK